MITVLNYILNLLVNRSAFVVAIYTGVLVLVNFVSGLVSKLAAELSSFDSIVAPTLSGSGVNIAPFSLMNYLLPLDLGLTLFGAWLAFHLTCTAFRIAKAFVPTVS